MFLVGTRKVLLSDIRYNGFKEWHAIMDRFRGLLVNGKGKIPAFPLNEMSKAASTFCKIFIRESAYSLQNRYFFLTYPILGLAPVPANGLSPQIPYN